MSDKGAVAEAADGPVQVGSYGRADVRVPGVVAAGGPASLPLPAGSCRGQA